jgi:hypothetical protein
MSFAFASPSAPGKQNGPCFGVRGSTRASKSSLRGVVPHPPLPPVTQTENRGFGMPPCQRQPVARCFLLSAASPCFPGFRVGGGEAKTSPKGRLYPLDFPKENWSGRRDSNPRPQPWQGCALSDAGQPNIRDEGHTTASRWHGRKCDKLSKCLPPAASVLLPQQRARSTESASI